MTAPRRRQAPRALALAACGTLAGLALAAAPAAASLSTFTTEVGNVRLSADAVGTLKESGVVQVQKPPGATVRKAFLLGASIPRHWSPVLGDVTLDGTNVPWDEARTLASGIGSTNAFADVTAIVKPKVDAAGPGRVDFTVREASPEHLDGQILAVVLDDPSAPVSTVALMYGSQSPAGDSFKLGLGAALKPSTRATMSLGISYGYQPGGQYSTVDVNGTRLTSSAGGQDDGEDANGGLITVGGLDDSTANPADPERYGCPEDARCDDELYDVKPFVPDGGTSIDIVTQNPSQDDNIFFAAVEMTTTAVVGKGITLTPTGTATEQTGELPVVALVQDEDGKPLVGTTVTLDVVEGPNKGASGSTKTGPGGKAAFRITSAKEGTDHLRATFVDQDVTYTSNTATHRWAPAVDETFDGLWPSGSTGEANLHWSYPSTGKYGQEMDDAVKRWNDAGLKVKLNAWPGAPYAVHLPVSDVNLPRADWWGIAVFAEDCWSCPYTRNAVLLNQRTLDGETQAQRTKTTTHELGHAIGLEHVAGPSHALTKSVMRQGRLDLRVTGEPQPYDRDRVEDMYP